MTTITEFLLARIAEDEAAVNDRTLHLAPLGTDLLEQFGDFGDDERWMIEIPAARVLAECKAKRAIVESVDAITGGEKTYRERLKHTRAEDAAYVIASDILRHLAAVYSDHPDYQQEWT